MKLAVLHEIPFDPTLIGHKHTSWAVYPVNSHNEARNIRKTLLNTPNTRVYIVQNVTNIVMLDIPLH